jgi:hypothetical protein
MGLRVVARLSTLVEAEVACATLRAAGFHAEVFDLAIGTVYWLYQTAIGGFRIVVPEDELEDAVGCLVEIDRSKPRIRRPVRKGDIVWSYAALGAILTLGSPVGWLIVGLRIRRRSLAVDLCGAMLSCALLAVVVAALGVPVLLLYDLNHPP